MIAYAHTLNDQPKEKWEPLFTPFGAGENECQREQCEKCKKLEPYHGHLNKVAYPYTHCNIAPRKRGAD